MIKRLILPLFLLCSYCTMTAQCNDVYSAATYALSHTKKSLKANNFDHQQQYAEKAYESFEKIKELIENCDCVNSLDPVLDGLDNLDKAIDPKTWDLGRHYSKKAFANAEDLMFALDTCSANVKKEKSEEESSEPTETLEKN